MQIGMIGLGKMGGNMSRRLMKAGHHCVVYDADRQDARSAGKGWCHSRASLADVVKALGEKPRAIWLMLPAGQVTEETVERLGGLLERDDIIIDGGNSFYKDDIRRAKKLAEKGIRYVDCGTSGGVWGIERGYCMMIGGPKEAVDHLDPIFSALAPGLGNIPRTPGREKGDSRAERGYIHAGPSGAGHFVKMVHNGIEYGMMQAYAEGFDILRNKDSKDLPEDERFTLNLPDIAEVWRRGSVISSWLLDLGAAALAKDPQLKDFSGFVQDSARVAGRSRPRSRKRSRRTCSPRRSSPVSARGRSIPSAKRCSQPCASASAATSRVKSPSTPNQSRKIRSVTRRHRTPPSSAMPTTVRSGCRRLRRWFSPRRGARPSRPIPAPW